MSTRLIHKGQQGFSLIELIIVIALTGIITTAITMTIFQVFNMNTRTANRMTAVSQVQHAGKLVSEDILQAQEEPVIGENPATNFLTLAWEEWATNDTHNDIKVIYTLDLEDNELWRSESVNDGEPTLTRVAEYIDPDQTSCVPVGDAFKFKVTANVGGQIETRIYEVKPRPGS